MPWEPDGASARFGTMSSSLLAPMSIGAGALAGICFLAILVFGLLAVRSLTGHIRKSHQPWQGEVDGGVPIDDGVPTDGGVTGDDGAPVGGGRPADGSTVRR